MRRYILIFLLTILALPAVADNVTNVRVRQEGKTIVVTYDLKKKSNVSLWMSRDNYGFKELKSVQGHVGKGVSAGKNLEIVWSPLEEYDAFIAKNVRFKVTAKDCREEYLQNGKVKTLLALQGGYSHLPQLSCGAFLGQMYNGVGWYVNARSNFNLDKPTDLICSAYNGINGVLPFYSGRKSYSHINVTAGLLLDFLEVKKQPVNRFNTFGMYAGFGYGRRELQMETTDGLWVKYEPTSAQNISATLGLFGGWKGVTLNVGVNTIGFKYAEMEWGIGFMF